MKRAAWNGPYWPRRREWCGWRAITIYPRLGAPGVPDRQPGRIGKGLAHYYNLRVDEVKLSVKRSNSWAPVLGRCSQTRFAEIVACARAASPVSRNQQLRHDRRLRP